MLGSFQQNKRKKQAYQQKQKLFVVQPTRLWKFLQAVV
jgi:hypothetical protein